VTIPANAYALVYVPAKDASQVTESGQPATTAPGVKFVRMEGNTALFAVGSGDYVFVAR
jgi:alpha-L-rhamnosidase